MPAATPASGEVTSTPLQYTRVVLLGLVLAANNTSIWMIFSFLPFMVEHFFPDLPVTQLGYEAGMLGSAFSAGSLIGNVLWGIVSDRAGRRPAMLCGLLGTAISALAFGFAPSFYMAVFARFMWGLLNGNLGVAKTYLSEISDDTNSAKGMAIFGAIGGAGRTIGPIIGGFLSSPAEKYAFFQGTIFETYPFALASAVVSINCLIVFVLSFIYIAETLPARAPTEEAISSHPGTTTGYSLLRTYEDLDSSPRQQRSVPSAIELSPMHSFSSKDSMESEEESKDSTALLQGQSSSPSSSTASLSPSSSTSSSPSLAEEGVPSQQSAALSPLHTAPSPSPSPTNLSDSLPSGSGKKRVLFSGIVEVSVIGSNELAYSSLKNIAPHERPVVHIPTLPTDSLENGDRRSIHRTIQYSNGADEEHDLSSVGVWGTIRSIMHQREVMQTCLLYGLNAFAVMVYNEIFPLWVVTPPKHGGFLLSSNAIGVLIMICGFFSIVMQTTLYPYLVNKIGILRMFKTSTVCLILTGLITPMISMLNILHSSVAVWTALILTLLLLTVSSNWAFISIFVLINNAAYRQQRATVNGLGQTFASLGRLCGPVLGASLFAWSEDNGLDWPLNYYLVFYLVAGVCAMSIYVVNQLPRSIERRKREPNDPTVYVGSR